LHYLTGLPFLSGNDDTKRPFGGFSGAGIYQMRLAADLVGIVIGYWPNFDLMHCTRSDVIRANGTIKHERSAL